MKRNSEPGPSSQKVAKKDVVSEALEKFRKGMNFSVSPQESSNESKIKQVAELEKKKILKEFMPLIFKSTGDEAYGIVLEIEAGIQKVIQEVEKAKVIEHHAEQTMALLSRMMDFAFKEFKSSMSLEKIVLPVLDPSLKTEMLSKFLDTNKDAAVKLSQLRLDVHQGQGHGSSLEDEVQEEPGPEIATEAARNAKEKKEFEKLESLILPILEDIRYPKDYNGKTPFPGQGRMHDLDETANITRGDLLSNIYKMRRLLNENNNFSSDKYRLIHARLGKAVKIARRVLYNARLYYPRAYSWGTDLPVYVDRNDCLMWCMSFDVDVRECLPSQRSSLKFKLDKAEFEVHFLRNLLKTKMIEDEGEEINLKLEGEHLGKRLQDLVKRHAESRNLDVCCSADLCLEAVHAFWKLKLNWRWEGMDLEDNEDEAEPEKSRPISGSVDDVGLRSDVDDDKLSVNWEVGSELE